MNCFLNWIPFLWIITKQVSSIKNVIEHLQKANFTTVIRIRNFNWCISFVSTIGQVSGRRVIWTRYRIIKVCILEQSQRGRIIFMRYLRLFVLSFVLQIAYFMLLIKDESITMLEMVGFSVIFTIIWYLTDKILSSRNKEVN